MMASKIETQGTFEQRLATLATQLGKQPATTPKAVPQNQKPEQQSVKTVDEAVQQLVGAAAQLARVDKTIAQMMEGVPDSDDAKQWFDISLQALQCSRNMLAEKQANYLKVLTDLVPEAAGKSGEPESEVMTVSSPVVAPPPGLTGPPGLTAPQPSAPEAPTWMGWNKEAVDACPEFVPAQKAANATEGNVAGSGSLKQDMEMLRECQPDCVIIVRKIKKLGFESPTFLSQHFQKYGEVKDVLVAHSHVKPTVKRPNGRVRPAALGFVVMADANGVEKALQAGKMQMVTDVPIELSEFTAFGEFEEEKEE